MFGLAPWVMIGFLVMTAMIPISYKGGHFMGAREQAAADRTQADLDAAKAVATALKEADEKSAAIVLNQVEATQREREGRKAVEARTADLEAEALERERHLAELSRPAVAPPSSLPAVIIASPVPPMVEPLPARCDPALGDDDVEWLRRAYPPGAVRRAAPARAATGGK